MVGLVRVSLGLGPNLIDRKLDGPESDTSAVWAQLQYLWPKYT